MQDKVVSGFKLFKRVSSTCEIIVQINHYLKKWERCALTFISKSSITKKHACYICDNSLPVRNMFTFLNLIYIVNFMSYIDKICNIVSKFINK